MKKQRKLLHCVALCVVVVCAFLMVGCDGPVGEHQEIDFSPEGNYVTFISDIDESGKRESAIMAQVADNEEAEPFNVYVAPEGVKIYSVYWKKDKIVFFESAEKWGCPEPPDNEDKSSAEKVPVFNIRIASIPSSAVDEKRIAQPEVIQESVYDCWIPTSEEEEGYESAYLLREANITNASRAGLIVYENFDKGKNSEGGFSMLDAEKGGIEPLLNGRPVFQPKIMNNGKKLAFYELVPVENEKTEDEDSDIVLKVLDMETREESEVTTIAGFPGGRYFGFGGRSAWSNDGKHFFFSGISSFSFTEICEREWLGDGKIEDEAEEEELVDEGLENGRCRIVRGTVESSDRNEDKFLYDDQESSMFTVHKYYTDYGIAVRLMDFVLSFSINPEKKEILAETFSWEFQKPGTYLFDYSGKMIREVDYEYVEEYEAIDDEGNVADVSAWRRHVLVLMDAETQEEWLIIARKQDLLAAARRHFDRAEYDKAKQFYDEYKTKHGLPEKNGDRLLMIATYQHTKDYEKVTQLTGTVPVEELQKYFAATQ